MSSHDNKSLIYRTQTSKRMDKGNKYSLTSESYRKGKGYDGHPLTLILIIHNTPPWMSIEDVPR
jgi:hypothetical protein